jgi:hypothetical protein
MALYLGRGEGYKKGKRAIIALNRQRTQSGKTGDVDHHRWSDTWI